MNKKVNKKKILITAGPVWVPIDKVRVMTNIFGGALGYEIAKQAAKLGFDVVLLMGPGRTCFTNKEKFKIIKFKYFEDIYELLKKEIYPVESTWLDILEVIGNIYENKDKL